MLLASLLAVYPLIDNAKADNFTNRYQLRISDNARQTSSLECAKRYDVRFISHCLQSVAASQSGHYARPPCLIQHKVGHACHGMDASGVALLTCSSGMRALAMQL